MSRKNLGRALLFVAVFAVVGFLFTAHYFGAQDSSLDVIERQGLPLIRVAVTAPMVDDMVRVVGGSRVTVASVSLADLARFTDRTGDLRDTQVLFAIGSGVDPWIEQVREHVKGLHVVVLESVLDQQDLAPSYDIRVAGTESIQQSRYWWLSFRYAQRMMQEMARQLGTLDVANKEYFLNNAYEYTVSLIEEQRAFLEALEPLAGYKALVLEGAFDDFVRDFKINAVGTFAFPRQSQERTKFLENLVRAVRKNNIRMLIVDSRAYADEIAAAMGDIRIRTAVLLPFGSIEYTRYIDIMRYNLSETLRALR